MSQQLLLKRGGISNIANANGATGELLIVTGSTGNLTGPFTLAGNAGTSAGLVNQIQTGTTVPTVDSRLNGLLFYKTDNNSLHILNSNGNIEINLNSGSFSGSFQGDGSNLTGITATSLDIDGFGSDLTGITLADTDKLILSDNGTEGRVNVSQLKSYVLNAVGGDITFSGDTATIGANAVALGTNTTGDYVESITGTTNQITVTGGTGEGSTPTLSLPQSIHTTADVTFNSVTADLTGNADTATALATARTITLGGDLTGNTSFDGSANVTLTATIAANSVALGTDTTGDYVGTLTAGTGITSTGATTGEGVAHSLSVDYGSTAGTAVEGDTALTIQGTSNEIEVTGGSITLGSGGTVTVGLPDSVNITTDLSVGGNLTVNGTVTTINSTQVELGDRIIVLNAADASGDSGIHVHDADSPASTGSLVYESVGQYWKAGVEGSEDRLALLNANMAANSFVIAAGVDKIDDVAASTAGDILQWNGSAMVASNVIDGGTF